MRLSELKSQWLKSAVSVFPRLRERSILTNIGMRITIILLRILGDMDSTKMRKTPHQCQTMSLNKWVLLKQVQVRCRLTITHLNLTTRLIQPWTYLYNQYTIMIWILTRCSLTQRLRTVSVTPISLSQWPMQEMTLPKCSERSTRKE